MGAASILHLLPSLSKAQDKTHSGILRTLPQGEGTAHPATSLCFDPHPPHPSSSSFSSSSPPPILAPAAAWAQHQDKRAVLLSTRLGQSSRGWSRVVLKGPNTVPPVTQQGFPNEERGGGEEKPISEEERTPGPPPHIRLPTFASHFLCVATLQTRGDGGEERC